MYEYGFAVSADGLINMNNLIVDFQNWINTKYSIEEVHPFVILISVAHSIDIVVDDEVIWSSGYDYDEELSLDLLKNNFVNYCGSYVKDYSRFLKEE